MLKHDVIEAAFQRSVQLYNQGMYPEALESLQGLLKDGAQHLMLFHIAAASAYSMQAYDQAEHYWKQALQIDPNFATAYCYLGDIYTATKRYGLVEQNYFKAMELQPNFADSYNGYGNFLAATMRHPEAQLAFRRAIVLKPDFAIAYKNLADLLAFANQIDEALACYRKVIELLPDRITGYQALGVFYIRIKKFAEAEFYLRKALTYGIDQPRICFNMALAYLIQGHFAEGWPLYESRYMRPREPEDVRVPAFKLPFPQWKGEPLAGKSLVVWHEQGFGDVIQFARYVRILKQQGATHITFVCKVELKNLFKTLDGLDDVVGMDEQSGLQPHDYWSFVLSLPLYVKTRMETIPSQVGYFDISKLARSPLLDQIPKQGLRVGLVWRGSLREPNDQRSIPSLEKLKPLWHVPGITFVSLQIGCDQEVKRYAQDMPLVHLGPHIGDFADTAAILKELDLLITVDTAIAHLAGALGVPVWTMLQFYADWRWLIDRQDNPWYPTMRVFRHQKFGEWEPVIDQISIELERLAKARQTSI